MEVKIIEKIINESFTDYLPQIPIQVDYDLRIFNTEILCKREGKRTLSEVLQKVNRLHQEPKKKRATQKEVEVIEIMDLDNPKEDLEIITALDKLDFEVDRNFKQVLKLHQVEGLEFLWERVYKARQGCLLAHAMGLGKSIQTIVFLTTMYQHLQKNPSQDKPGNRVLLLAPLVTLSNWVNEFQKWSIEGAENIIGEVFNFSQVTKSSERLAYLKYWYAEGGVMLMSYEAYRLLHTGPRVNEGNREHHFQMLVDPGPDVVILDEGHRIKNINSSIANIIYQIRTQLRICLTGYPIQNNLMEYYYMINFVAPNLLGCPEQFKSAFKTTIEKCYTDSSRSRKNQAAVKLYVLQLLTNYVTHRRDDTILKAQLPGKHEYVIRFKMSSAQFQGYARLVKYAEKSSNPLVGLIILRALCNHPKILETLLKRRNDSHRKKALDKEFANEKDSSYIQESEINEAIISIPEDIPNQASLDENAEYSEEELLAKISDAAYEWMKDYFDRPDIETWKCSGKISFIADLAQNCKALKEKLVIVSHSLACLDYMQRLLPIFDTKLLRLDGSTVGLLRQKIIDTFQEDASYGVLLLSAKAAAIGINLTAANRIVLIDQDWNPLYDEQSIGRLYRYGQTKPVHVYRLITASTIEERIFKQSVHKRSISRRVIDNKVTAGISRDELTEYYKSPSENIPLINPEKISQDAIKDYIDYSVLKENMDCITSCQPYETHLEDQDDMSVWSSKLSDHDKSTAKDEAKQLFKKWKQRFV